MSSPSPNTAGLVGTDAPPPGEAEIIERIYDAVMERRLPPGTKLSEAALCQAFGVRRSRIRRSLLLLASRNIVDLHANRGAFVSRPTAAEARHVFEARRTVETAVARLAAERAEPGDLAKLAAHLGAEERAISDRDRRRSIRLSGEFHVLVAEAARNQVLHDVVRDLVARSSLIIAMYGSSADTCRTGEHGELLNALRDGDPQAAAGITADHLLSIEAQLAMGEARGDGIDLVQLFSR
ncbi:MAG TPA: GntR family transcriptional regulator [Paracoccaceae bacterium]|nr:GntR family transcriptional regulator [Paracoccaceae bacterium]